MGSQSHESCLYDKFGMHVLEITVGYVGVRRAVSHSKVLRRVEDVWDVGQVTLATD